MGLDRAGRLLAVALLATFAVASAVRPSVSSDPPPAQPPLQSSGPAGGLPDGARVSERLLGLAGLSNVGRVAPGIYRGAQPEPEGYRTLKTMGVRTVINLRQRHTERAAVEAAGLRSIEIPMSTTAVQLETVERVVALMADPVNQPVFVHCAQGQDRTGVVTAVYRMKVDGWSNAQAEAEMQAFGFNDVWRPLLAFVRAYRAQGPARPQ